MRYHRHHHYQQGKQAPSQRLNFSLSHSQIYFRPKFVAFPLWSSLSYQSLLILSLQQTTLIISNVNE